MSRVYEEKIKDAIETYMLTNNYPPSIRDICKYSGINSTSTVQRYILRMIDDGKLVGDPKIARSVIIPEIRYRKEQ